VYNGREKEEEEEEEEEDRRPEAGDGKRFPVSPIRIEEGESYVHTFHKDHSK